MKAPNEISVLANSFAWLTSSACDEHYQLWWSGILYLLLAPCPHHLLLLLGLHGVCFLILLVSFVFGKRALPGFNCESNSYFKATVAVTVLVASAYSVAGVCCLALLWFCPQGSGSPFQLAYLGVQASAWAAFVGTLGHEKKFGFLLHSLPLRLWWAANSLLSASTTTAVLLRLVLAPEQSDGATVHLRLDDWLTLATFPAAAFLFVVSLRGLTGITAVSAGAGQSEPLLNGNLVNGRERSGGAHESAYAHASLFSRLLWLWVNPLLKVGSKGTLQLVDVPILAPQDRTEHLYSLLEAHFPAQLTRNTVTGALFKCFRRWFLLNGILMLVKTSVMFVGPILISKFIDFASASGQPAYRGYVLVIILLAAKCTEVLSAHQYNFHSQRLGMRVRSSMITTVYRKGLRLPTAGRQAHGIGQIVNYMTVDVQQLSDCIFQLHNVWALPLQVLVAVIILFRVVGVSMVAGVASMLGFAGIAVMGSRWQRYYHSHIMKHRDSRMKATTEVLSSIKVIKLQSWEEHFRKRVEDLRLTEYGWLVKFVVTMGANIFSMWISATVVGLVTFTCAALIGFELTPAIVFTAITTFRILQEPVRALPQVLTAVAQALVSLDRLDKFLQSEELDTQTVTRLAGGADLAISVDRSSFTWDTSAKSPTLSNINVHIQPGSLVAIVGMVGCGKSSLLSSFLGEMPKLAGKVTIIGTTAYVPQTSWIQNGTIEENIRFGGPMDMAKYQEAIRVCSLAPDLELLEFGDQTEIGERGINLSGGQKQRIQLARAVYQDCDLYLLDDIFSAVDAHTGSHLFKKCILGTLAAKTRVVVTHQVEFLHRADQILVMRKGTIVQSGKYNDLLQAGTHFHVLVQAHKDAMDSVDGHEVASGGSESKDEALEKAKSGGFDLLDGIHSKSTRRITKSDSGHDSLPPSQQQSSRTNIIDFKGLGPEEKTGLKKGTAKLIDEERRQVGRVGWSVYRLYVTKAYGWPAVVAVVLIQSVWQILLICCDYWLAYETSPEREAQFRPRTFILGYLYLAIGICISVLLRTILVVAMGSKSAQGFFLGMLRCVLRAPMSFFDTTPTGRILSRASSDQTTLDILLPFHLSAAVAVYSASVATLIVICQVTWPTVFVIAPLTYVYFSYQSYFIVTSRELTRIGAITSAPVIHHFSESVAGVAVIRSFQKQEEFGQVNVERVDSNIRLDFHNNAANEWLGYRLEMIGTIILCTSALLIVVLPRGYIDYDLVGLSLSYGLALNTCLYWSVTLGCLAENRMVSVERLRQFSTIPSETPLVIRGIEPPSDWPHQGEISIQDLQLRYRPNTPLVLKGISVSIKGGQKIGVVGRTGSGKSTLLQAIFRLIEPAGGRIIIDGVDISGLGLTDLRSRMSIIPQEPTLFQGSIRMNLDPLGEFKDEQIWEVLCKCQMESAVLEQPHKLDSQVVAGGDNWSVGQKQLFCLGRVLLKCSRILFLDEATDSVDSHTDAVIQKIVKEDFDQCTQVSIAHRITTVMDSDNVIVMDAGKVVEYESPSRLLHQPNSLFGALVREYSTRSGKMS